MKNVRGFNTVAEAEAFVEGVEYVNDSAIRVERHETEVWIFDEDEDEKKMGPREAWWHENRWLMGRGDKS